MRIERSLPLSLLLLLPVTASAQVQGVKGQVLTEDGEPVGQAQVLIEFLATSGQPPAVKPLGTTKPLTVTTGARGQFLMIGLAAGHHRLTVTKEGFASATREVRVRLGHTEDAGQVVLHASAWAASPESPSPKAVSSEEVEAQPNISHETDAGRRYSSMEPDEARTLVVELWSNKRFPPPPINPLGYWDLPHSKLGELDAKGARLDTGHYVVIARALQPAETYVADSIVKGGGCFVAAALLYSSADLTVSGPPAVGAPTGTDRPASLIRSGGYIWSIGLDGLLFSQREKMAFVAFKTPLARDPCEGEALTTFEVSFSIPNPEDGIVATIAGRTVQLR